MKLRRAFSSAAEYLKSVTETLPGGEVIALAKGAYFHLARDMDGDPGPYRALLAKGPALSDTPLTLHFDGAALNNPGPAGCGFVFGQPKAAEVAGFSVNLFTGTNNMAEYSGLVYGLFVARLAGTPS
jgi:hypothetical protein